MDESGLYPAVEELLRSDTFGCFKSAQRKGTIFVGTADVVGVREIGGDVRGDVEVISVEVKQSTGNFGKILGQALGYSLFAHRCYLAVAFKRSDKFSIEQKELANRLGVGLVHIGRTNRSWTASEVMTSKVFQPHPHQVETLLRRGLKLVRCSLCGVFADLDEVKATYSWDSARDKGKAYIMWRDSTRPLMFSKRTKGDRRRLYLCHECVSELWEGIALENQEE